MAQFSPQQQQPPLPQAEPKIEAEAEAEDLTLADSFFNYDYVPDMSPQHDDPDPDPICFGYECNRVEEFPEAEAEAEGVVNLGDLGLCGGVEEGIENISLVGDGNGDDDDDNGHESEGDSESSDKSESESKDFSSSSSSTSSESQSDNSDGGKEEKRDDDEKSELEEGEIVESDDDHDYDDDSDSDSDGDRPIRSKNELEILPSVPPVNVTLEPHHRMLPVGHVTSVVDDQVIVEGVEKHEPLNEGSILWITESRKLLGLVDEIFGQVENPYYVLRYNSVNEVPKGIHAGTLVSSVAEFTNPVLNNKDLFEKGYDYDEEASEPEFSDDEKEAEYRKRKERMAKWKKNKGKMFPPKESVASAAPFHDHGSCSTFSGNGQGPFGARNVAPATPSNDHGHCSSFSGNGQVPFGATAVAPAAPSHDQGRSSAFSGNGQVHFGQTTVAPAAPSHNQGHSSAFPGNGQGHFGARIVAPAAPLHGQGQSSTFSGNGQGPFGAPTVVPPFPPANAGPNLNTAAVWTNGATLLQPQPPMLPNGFPTNGMPWFPANTQISHQLPVPGVPFQQLLNPNQVFGLAMFPAQPVYAQGLGFQNQMAFGSISPFLQVQPPIFPVQQGFPCSELHPGTNPNVAPGSVPFNHQAPHQFQFHSGVSSNRGRRKFNCRGSRGWRSAR